MRIPLIDVAVEEQGGVTRHPGADTELAQELAGSLAADGQTFKAPEQLNPPLELLEDVRSVVLVKERILDPGPQHEEWHRGIGFEQALDRLPNVGVADQRSTADHDGVGVEAG